MVINEAEVMITNLSLLLWNATKSAVDDHGRKLHGSKNGDIKVRYLATSNSYMLSVFIAQYKIIK